MSTLRLISSIAAFAALAAAQVVVSPAAFSTVYGSQPNGLSWAPIASPTADSLLYVGTTLTASGGVGISAANPYRWTIVINGATAQQCSASQCVTPVYQYDAPATHAGQIDASADATGTNATVVYRAPTDYPSAATVSLCASDGATQACAVATIPTGALPGAYERHRARSLGLGNWPYGVIGANDASGTLFPNPYMAGLFMGTLLTANADVFFPVTAGSNINRPAWSYNGQFFLFRSPRCFGSKWCPTAGQIVQWTDADGGHGRNSQDDSSFALWNSFTWDYHDPTDVIASSEGRGIGGNLDSNVYQVGLVDLANLGAPAVAAITATSTVNGCNGAPCALRMESQVGGTDQSRIFLKAINFGSPGQSYCYPVASCQGGGNGPLMRIYSLAPCEAANVAGCASLLSTWNLNLGLGSGDNATGTECANGDIYGNGGVTPGTSIYFNASNQPHQIACEFGAHDIYYIRGQDRIIWNYGTVGSVSEFEFFAANDDGSGVVQFYPQQDPAINRGYWSHPAFNSTGDLISFGGESYCDQQPNQECDTLGTFAGGVGFWDTRRDGHCGGDATYPDPDCGLYSLSQNVSYGHGAWDGFDNGVIGHDGNDDIGGTRHEFLAVTHLGQNRAAEELVYDYGNRPEGTGVQQIVSGIINSPTQSPDATKLAEPMLDAFGFRPTSAEPELMQDAYVPYWFEVRAPRAPVRVSAPSTAAATVQWYAAPLNRETQTYWVWKQPSCSGAWSRLAPVTAVYLQAGPYSYTDAALGSGDVACYGLTSQEWSGFGSLAMSAVVRIANSGGSFSGSEETAAGTSNFDAAPAPVSGLAASPLALGQPLAPHVSAGGSGSLAAGSWSVQITYCKYTDFPADTQCSETLPSPAVPATVSANQLLQVTNVSNNSVGQDAFCVYAKAPGDAGYHRENCIAIPDGASDARPGGGPGPARARPRQGEIKSHHVLLSNHQRVHATKSPAAWPRGLGSPLDWCWRSSRWSQRCRRRGRGRPWAAVELRWRSGRPRCRCARPCSAAASGPLRRLRPASPPWPGASPALPQPCSRGWPARRRSPGRRARTPPPGWPRPAATASPTRTRRGTFFTASKPLTRRAEPARYCL